MSWEFESPSLHAFIHCGNSSVGRARPSQGRGRGFEPRFSLKMPKTQTDRIRTTPLKHCFNGIFHILPQHITGTSKFITDIDDKRIQTQMRRQILPYELKKTFVRSLFFYRLIYTFAPRCCVLTKGQQGTFAKNIAEIAQW